jgi:hypothetical protein
MGIPTDRSTQTFDRAIGLSEDDAVCAFILRRRSTL